MVPMCLKDEALQILGLRVKPKRMKASFSREACKILQKSSPSS